MRNKDFYLIYEEFYDIDDYCFKRDNISDADKNKMGLGINFQYGGRNYRAAIKFDKNINGNDLLKLWKKLAKSIDDPEDKDSKAILYPGLLSGNEITLEDCGEEE